MRRLALLAAGAALLASLACGTGRNGPPAGSIAVTVQSSSALVYPQQPAVTVNVTLSRSGATGNVTLSVQGLPSGASATFQQPGSGNSGTVALSATSAPAGDYRLSLIATDGSASGGASLTLTVGVVAHIATTKNGRFQVAMSTSFQPAEWDYQFFSLNPSATVPLGNLLPNHVRLQGVSQGVPQRTANTWDFSTLDAITQPVLAVGDHSPEFQIAKAPPFLYVNGDSNNSFLDLTFQQFAAYTQYLVDYYNKGGFTSGDGVFHESPAYPAETVTWWGIYNEPNINNNLTPQQYVSMYNAVVPAMHAVDPALKFVALELADFSQEPRTWLPPFVSNSTGVKAQVDAMATHFYSTCNQKDSDAKLFGTIPQFASDVNYFYQQMATNPALASVPVWVTENNVNADYDKGGGISNCNGGTFVEDVRGSSPFFAAWRPLVFSLLGKAGAKALYHWDFDADRQYGEVDYTTGAYQLSYWVDYWLGRTFPSALGADLLDYTATDLTDVEILPVLNSDGSVTVMISDYAVQNTGDNNGSGLPRTVLVDTTAWGNFTSASLMTIDANTSVATGPAPSAVSPAAQLPVTLNGYGVALLNLRP